MVYSVVFIWFSCTGLLVLQDAVPLFCTTHLARRNYWAELAQIWHGTPNGDNSRFYRGVFGNSVRGPRYGVPKGSRRGAKKFERFFLDFFVYFNSNGFRKLNSLVYAKISPSFNHFNVQGARKVGLNWQSVEAGRLQESKNP